MNLERLRTLASAEVRPVAPNLERLQLVADPKLRAEALAHQERERNELWWRQTVRTQGKGSGWRKGRPQCPQCKKFTRPDGWCESCKTYAESGYDHGR